MTLLERVDLGTSDPDRFADVMTRKGFDDFSRAMRGGARDLDGGTFWNVNSTSTGGGVAEMLSALLPYARGAGWDARWVVIHGDPHFYSVTKGIHNALHGAPTGDLGAEQREVYGRVAQRNAEALLEEVVPGDVVLVHDPQTAGMIPPLVEAGARVVWQCHVGTDDSCEDVRRAWDFLIDDVRPAHRYVFTRATYLWEGLDPDRLRVVPPSIDAFSVKNQHMDPEAVEAILRAAAVVDGEPAGPPSYARRGGERDTLKRRVCRSGHCARIPADARIVLQVSRWDRLKDPVGLMRAFAEQLRPPEDVHLVLAGPAVDAVSDDPEGLEVLGECEELWRTLPESVRERVHLLSVPVDDADENAAVINALQRRADVVVQKSLQEGFGLTVAEGMWKGRPVVGSRVGGIQDQIEHDNSGVLVDDPEDLRAAAGAIGGLLSDPRKARLLGRAAARRVRERFLGPRQLSRYAAVIEELVGTEGRRAG